MSRKDIYGYINNNFKEFLEPISELSKSAKTVLVNDNRHLFNFDKITENIYEGKKVPSSADSLWVKGNEILLTEFKSGFKRKISKETLDDSKLKCPYDETRVCKDFGKLLIDKGKLETNELLDSLKFKAIESYITLEKKIFPLCPLPSKGKIRVIFCAVVDDYVDSMEDTLSELAGGFINTNTFQQVRDSLSRFIGLKSQDGENFYYDKIEIMSPYEYQKYISKYFS